MDHNPKNTETDREPVLFIRSNSGSTPLGIFDIVEGCFPLLYAEQDWALADLLAKNIEGGGLLPAPIWVDGSPPPMVLFRDRVFGLVITELPRRPLLSDEILFTFLRPRLPQWFFLEHPSCHHESDLLDIYEFRQDIQRLGYLSSDGLFSAAEVGSPIRRQRYFLLGVLAGSHLPRLTLPEWALYPLRRVPDPAEPVACRRDPYKIFAPIPMPHFQFPFFPLFPCDKQHVNEVERISESHVDRTTVGSATSLDVCNSRQVDERCRAVASASVPPQVSYAFYTLHSRLSKCVPQKPKKTPLLSVMSPAAPNPPSSPTMESRFAILTGSAIADLTLNPPI